MSLAMRLMLNRHYVIKSIAVASFLFLAAVEVSSRTAQAQSPIRQPKTFVPTSEMAEIYTSYTSNVAKELWAGGVHLSVSPQCLTRLQVTRKTAEDSPRVRIEVSCKALKPYVYGALIDVSEEFNVTSQKRKSHVGKGGKDEVSPDLEVKMEFPMSGSLTDGSEDRVAVLTESILAVLKANPVENGTGLNRDTKFVKYLVPDSYMLRFEQEVTTAVYTDRLPEFSERLAKMILSDAGADKKPRIIP